MGCGNATELVIVFADQCCSTALTSRGRARLSVPLTGGVNLMRHAKKSTNRDFRVVFKALPEPEAEEEEAETEDDEVIQVCITRM